MPQENTNNDGLSEPAKSEESKKANPTEQTDGAGELKTAPATEYQLDQKKPSKAKRGKGRKNNKKTDSSHSSSKPRRIHSWELNETGEAALAILRARDPEKPLKDLISAALALAVGILQATRIIQFAVPNSGDLIRVQGEVAKLERILKRFREDLIAIQKDPETAVEIATLADCLETQLTATAELRARMAKLGRVPSVLKPENLEGLWSLKAYLEDAHHAVDEPMFAFALKLLAPYLP